MTDTQDEIEKVLTTLFHSYDAKGNQLAIDEAEAAIEKLILEARIDQMEYVNQRMIGKNTSGDRVFYDKDNVIAENRLLNQQRIIFNAMEDELKAKLGDK